MTGIVDTHVHFIDPGRFVHPWLARRPDVDRRFLEREYRQAIGGADVSRIVLIEAAVRDDDAIGEAEWMSGLATQSPLVGAVAAQARLERGAAARDELDRLARLPHVTGIRRVVRPPFQTDPDFCARPGFIAGARLLAEYDLSFDVACGPTDLANVATLADSCPDVRFIVDHIANPPSDPAAFAAWKDGLRELARRPNVACKISGQQTHLPAGWDAAAVRAWVEPAADAFGPSRILFGSDVPVQTAGGGFAPWLAALEAIFAGASPGERDLFFGGNARRLYRIV